MKDYLALTKPRITWLILMSTGIGFFFGAKPGWSWITLFHTILGTGLLASGTAALNQWFEREADGKMRRTQARPLPSGKLREDQALLFGLAISAAGFFELQLAVNPLAALLGALTLLSYLFLYTPLKRRSPHSTTIGAIPGAMPPLIGFAAASGTLNWQAWILFAILFLWQFPHFYAIAWMYREDYERAGIRMLPVVEPDGQSTARRILAVFDSADSDQPDSEISLDGGEHLSVRRAGARVAVPLCRHPRKFRSHAAAALGGCCSPPWSILPVLYGLLLLDRPA